MPLSRARVAGLYSRRGSYVQWYPSLGVPQSTLNPTSLERDIPLGAARTALGPYGETYLSSPITINALLSNKVSQEVLAAYGTVETGSYQLGLPLPFSQACGTTGVSPVYEQRYNDGYFYQDPRGGTPQADRFYIEGARFIAIAKPVPIIDANTIISWRLLVRKDEA